VSDVTGAEKSTLFRLPHCDLVPHRTPFLQLFSLSLRTRFSLCSSFRASQHSRPPRIVPPAAPFFPRCLPRMLSFPFISPHSFRVVSCLCFWCCCFLRVVPSAAAASVLCSAAERSLSPSRPFPLTPRRVLHPRVASPVCSSAKGRQRPQHTHGESRSGTWCEGYRWLSTSLRLRHEPTPRTDRPPLPESPFSLIRHPPPSAPLSSASLCCVNARVFGIA